MNEEQFRQRAQEQGYGDFQTKDYDPNRDGPLHTHEFSVMLLVLGGQFTLAFEDGTTNYRPGEVCELAANVMHTERAGPAGAKVLLARRRFGGLNGGHVSGGILSVGRGGLKVSYGASSN